MNEQDFEAALMAAAPTSEREIARLVRRGAGHLLLRPSLREALSLHLRKWAEEEGAKMDERVPALLIGGSLEGLTISEMARLTGWWPALEELAITLGNWGKARVHFIGTDPAHKVEIL